MAQNEKYKLVIVRDDGDNNPRTEQENLGTMVCWHRRYTLGDEQSTDTEEPDALVVLPLYLYDHSGLTMSTGAFGCGFDSGQVGWIYMKADNIRELLGLDIGQPIVLDDDKRERVIACLKAEVAEYDAYLRGDVWGFRVFKRTPCECCKHIDEEEVDSCWGFVNLDTQPGDTAKMGIAEHLGDELKLLLDEAWDNRFG